MALFMACLWAQPIFSQRPDTLAHRSIGTVVIQATRAEARNPVPHTDLSSEKIAQQYHAQDLPYLLSSVPSLVESSDGGTGIGYTGLRIRGSDPTRVNVTLNGIPLNDAESQGVFWVNLPDLAASAAELQVQRGVGTSTNGAGAFGATVNVDLSKVEPDPYARLSATVGAFGTHKQSVQMGTGLLKERFAASARASRIRSDGYVDRASADMSSLHLIGTYLDARQSLQAHLLSGHERSYQAWYGLPAQYLEQPAQRTYNPAGTERPGSPYPDEVDDYTQRHFLLHYKRLLSGERLQWQLNGHYTRGFGYYEQYKADQLAGDYGLTRWSPGDTTSSPNDLVRRRWLDNDFYGATFALKWSPQHPYAPMLMLGGAASRYVGKHFGEVVWAEQASVLRDGYRYYDNDAQKRDANIFLKAEISPLRTWMLFADLQVRGVNYRFLGFNNFLKNVRQQADLLFFNPKAGFSWRFSPRWTAYGYLGVAQREPNRDDYTQSTPASRPLPERLLDAESGLRGQGSRWTASLNLYWMQYRNQLVLNGRINDVGAYIRSNVPRSRRVGIEAEASLRAHERLTLSGNVCLSQNRVEEFAEYVDVWDDGSQRQVQHRRTDLAFSPRVLSRAEATCRLWGKKSLRPAAAAPAFQHVLQATLSAKHVGQQYLDNTSNVLARLPAYTFADLRLNYDWWLSGGQQLGLVVSVLNLFDARYSANGWVYRYISAGYDARPSDAYTRDEGNDVYHQAGFFPQAGRHWMATLRVGF